MGTGSICTICGKVISPVEVENEVDIRADGVADKLWAHLPCLKIWQSESDAHEAGDGMEIESV